MQAIILAAGRGRRLGDRRPKCLQEVGGAALVDHQLRALADAGIHDVVIVIGFEADQVREVVGNSARYVVNERFAETNSLYSFLLARPLVDEDVVVMNSDVYAAPELVGALARAEGDAFLYDSSSGHDLEHMKVQVADGVLVEMAKDLPPGRICGENVGMLRMSAGTADLTFDAATVLLAGNGGEEHFLAAAVNCTAAHRPIRCLDVAGTPWIEIDYPEDLDRARTEVFPAVAGSPWGEERLALAGATYLVGTGAVEFGLSGP